MKVLVTGAAGFIGSHLVKALSAKDYEVVGLDNLNTYYEVELKYLRLADAGIQESEIIQSQFTQSTIYPSYRFIKLDLTDRQGMEQLFDEEKFDKVVNLAAQAGVRYSIENPYAYIQSNIVGFLNVLENCRNHKINHLIYASSSSVYGMNHKVPFQESDQVDSPVSLYAATKKADELMAHSYSKLYSIPTTGVRFFTVYGPWGRPDMAPFIFLKSILNGDPIKVFNHGQLSRDFTYIDDIVNGLMSIVDSPSKEIIPYQIYNIGNSVPVQLMDFISVIENITGLKAIKQMTDMQPGDVVCTYADITKLQNDFGYTPSTSIEEGIRNFYNWFIKYYKK